ncbi:hypothetical protein ACVI1I_006363 [Bradyrhizobium sp. USDA 4459]
MATPSIEPFEQRRQKFRRRQTHHAILDLRLAEDTFLEPLGEQAKTCAIPEDQLDPVRPLGTEHINSTRERIGRIRPVKAALPNEACC